MSSPRVRNRRTCGLTPCASRRAHEPPRTPTPSDRDAPRHRGRRAGPVPRRSAVGGSRPGLGAARDRMGRARHRRPVPRGGGGLNVQRSTNRSLSHVANRPGMSGDSVLCTRATIFRFGPAIIHTRRCDSPDESARCGQGTIIGRAFAAGRPVAPLPRRGTDAGEDAMRVLA